MQGQPTTELEFIQIASGTNAAGGHTLYGLTRGGRVFVFERGLAGWKPMPMVPPPGRPIAGVK